MNSKKTLKPSAVLYKSIFENRSPDAIIATISDGISIIIENAKGLLNDADILIKNNRYMSASFLGVTAREEIAKVHILIDACRLDLKKHDSTLKRLCKAFYNHIDKYAYYNIYMLPRINSMAEAKDRWKALTKKWWPADFQTGEPDQWHSTNWLREMPLYVDFNDWDNEWFNPQAKRGKLSTKARIFQIEDATEELSLLEKTHKLKLYDTNSLIILNNVFKKNYITMSTPTDEVISLYKKIGKLLERNNVVSIADFDKSLIIAWPLYSFC